VSNAVGFQPKTAAGEIETWSAAEPLNGRPLTPPRQPLYQQQLSFLCAPGRPRPIAPRIRFNNQAQMLRPSAGRAFPISVFESQSHVHTKPDVPR